MKKLLAVILTLVMMFSVAPFSAVTVSAATSGTTGNCTWRFDGAVLTISGNGSIENYDEDIASPWKNLKSEIAEIIIENGVNGIGAAAFTNCVNLTSVTIPNSVTYIGSCAFNGCINLENITIPNSVISIQDTAFGGCSSLTNVTFGDNITNIDMYAFTNCVNLTSLTIPDTITCIGSYAFYGCSKLSSVTIPDSVRGIESNAFDDTACYYDSSNWKNDIFYIGNHLIKASAYISGYCEINDGTITISNNAFYNCGNIIGITIPDKVKRIGHGAFNNCVNLESIIIPDSVTHIETYAFYNTSYYNNSDNWENDVLYVGNHLVEANDLIANDYEIKSGTKTIANSAFYDCSSLESIIIPNGVTTVGEFAFYSCSRLKSANLPDSITNIGKYAFYKCEKLANIIIPNSISKIDDHTFYNCFSLSSVTIGKNVIKIGDSAFFNCYNLKNITIPNGVTSINDHAFYCCSRLKSITIPSSIISVDYKAFYGCNNLTDVWYDGSKDEKNRINISAENDYFINAVWHYNRVDECIHNYTTVTNKSTLTSNGSIVTKCSVCGTPLNTFSLAKIASVTTTKKVTYNGKTNTPTVIVKDANGKIISSSNYNLKYASGRKNYGKYKITVTFKGNYSGSKSIYFEIVPKNSKISKLTAKKKSLIVKIKRNKSVSGYQIQYSLKKNFKGTKTVTLKKNSITSKTIKKLKAKKFYYVRVRTYKTYKGKKYYSAWSSAKKKKTK